MQAAVRRDRNKPWYVSASPRRRLKIGGANSADKSWTRQPRAASMLAALALPDPWAVMGPPRCGYFIRPRCPWGIEITRKRICGR